MSFAKTASLVLWIAGTFLSLRLPFNRIAICDRKLASSISRKRCARLPTFPGHPTAMSRTKSAFPGHPGAFSGRVLGRRVLGTPMRPHGEAPVPLAMWVSREMPLAMWVSREMPGCPARCRGVVRRPVGRLQGAARVARGRGDPPLAERQAGLPLGEGGGGERCPPALRGHRKGARESGKGNAKAPRRHRKMTCSKKNLTSSLCDFAPSRFHSLRAVRPEVSPAIDESVQGRSRDPNP